MRKTTLIIIFVIFIQKWQFKLEIANFEISRDSALLTVILEFEKTHQNHSQNDSLDQECVHWNMLKLEWKQILLWKLMKVCNRTRDPLTKANWSLTDWNRSVHCQSGDPWYRPKNYKFSANEVMAIESVRGACQQMGVKEFFQLAICVGVKNDSYWVISVIFWVIKWNKIWKNGFSQSELRKLSI